MADVRTSSSVARTERPPPKTFRASSVGFGEVINAYARKNISGYSYNADYTVRKDVTQLPFLLSFGVLVKF